VQSGAEQVLSRSVDGWTCSTPTSAVTDGRDAMLAVAMNGEPLPLEHGFPVRMVVPGLYGYVSATKWVTELELTTFDETAYWTTRGYADQAPIKSSVAHRHAQAPREARRRPSAIAGVAWAQGTGIASVEVSIAKDLAAGRLAGRGGGRHLAPVGAAVGRDAPGSHRLVVRATTRPAITRPPPAVPSTPDGATGRQEVLVTVA
jgi:hypothetical protein